MMLGPIDALISGPEWNRRNSMVGSEGEEGGKLDECAHTRAE